MNIETVKFIILFCALGLVIAALLSSLFSISKASRRIEQMTYETKRMIKELDDRVK